MFNRGSYRSIRSKYSETSSRAFKELLASISRRCTGPAKARSSAFTIVQANDDGDTPPLSRVVFSLFAKTMRAKRGLLEDGGGGQFAEERRQAIATLTTALGEARLAELRARGAAMDNDEVIAYAGAAISRALNE